MPNMTTCAACSDLYEPDDEHATLCASCAPLPDPREARRSDATSRALRDLIAAYSEEMCETSIAFREADSDSPAKDEPLNALSNARAAHGDLVQALAEYVVYGIDPLERLEQTTAQLRQQDAPGPRMADAIDTARGRLAAALSAP